MARPLPDGDGPDRPRPARRARALEISPESDDAHYALAILDLLEGRPEAALADASSVGKPDGLAAVALAHHELGHEQESRRALDELVGRHAHNSAESIADAYAWLGDRDRAFEWLDRALADELWGVKFDPLLRKLHGDPRWNALLRKMNLPPD